MIWNMRIKHLREQNKLTLKEIASKLGCSEATAQRYENNNGIKNIPYEVILKFAEIFDVSPAYINAVFVLRSRLCGAYCGAYYSNLYEFPLVIYINVCYNLINTRRKTIWQRQALY